MNAQLPVRRLMDDFRFHLARTESLSLAHCEHESPPFLSQVSVLSEDGERLRRLVRSSAFFGLTRGHGLAVSYVFDPAGSEAVAFWWNILLDARCEPTFVVQRNGKKIHQASNQLAGKFSNVLNRHEHYLYVFGLVVGQRELDRPAIAELVVPPFPFEESTPESAEERRRKREAWKKVQSEEAAFYSKDPQALKMRLAEIDAEACEKFGEE